MNWSDKIKVSYEAMLMEKGISKRELAKRVGLTYDTVKGKFPNTEVIAKICAYFQCSVNKVIDFDIKYKDKYNTAFIDHDSEGGGVSYYPLRFLFSSTYRFEARKKFDEFVKIVPNGINESQGKIKGLSWKKKSALKRDLPVSIKDIYHICDVLKCPPDYVFTYQ